MTPEAFVYLCGLSMDAVEQPQVAAIESYCDLWLADRVPNQPIRMDGATLEPEIGQARFSQAKQAREKISAGDASILQKLARMSRTWPRGNSGTQSKVVKNQIVHSRILSSDFWKS